jgi:oxaloacetate decarboxylase gamma subunit
MQSLLYQGFDLAIFGMGTVFLFLTLLVIVTSLMSRIILAFEPEPTIAEAGSGSTLPEDPREIAAIAAAVQQFRADRQQQ